MTNFSALFSKLTALILLPFLVNATANTTSSGTEDNTIFLISAVGGFLLFVVVGCFVIWKVCVKGRQKKVEIVNDRLEGTTDDKGWVMMDESNSISGSISTQRTVDTSSKDKEGKNGKDKDNSGKDNSGKAGKDNSDKDKSGKARKDNSGKSGKDNSGKADKDKSGKDKSGKDSSGKDKSGKKKPDNADKTGKEKSGRDKSKDKSGKERSGKEKNDKDKSSKDKSKDKSGQDKSSKSQLAPPPKKIGYDQRHLSPAEGNKDEDEAGRSLLVKEEVSTRSGKQETLTEVEIPRFDDFDYQM
ncbi:unnamed protein product [Bursaphelenchus okinawaensis]|uniref:Uncharacterized protein n=1 Tax=Bursaphelenchus okinawaensis TaxID=465554 RepID=A0A811KF59_9BILA|nr:unnamed protein product [Bursaphelenchus okinawaensis]CAG9100950.1 unnamed protein product [Bursaphelenchus okinawaensis]